MSWWNFGKKGIAPPAGSAGAVSASAAGPKKGLGKLFSSLDDKKKQRLIVIGVGVAFLVGVIGLVQLSESWKERSKTAQDERLEKSNKPNKRMTLLSERVEKDLWIAAEGQNVKAISKNNDELRAEMTKMANDLAALTKKQKEDDQNRLKPQAATPPKVSKVPIPPIPGQPQQFEARANTAAGTTQITANHNFSKAPGMSGAGMLGKPLSAGPGAIRIIEDELKGKTKETDHNQTTSKKGKPDEWIPSGSFMKVVLLNGIDAPTSGGAQAEPYPVLMSILDLSTLPNRFRLDMRECFIIGAGYGNISDERAYIRTEKLSCVRKDGAAVDMDLKGHVIGEDGKLGLRGRLISKQGQQIAMAMFAGTLGGIGTALKPTGNVTLNLGDNSTTSVNRPNPGDVATSAGLGGVGSALDSVAKYYLKLAEKLFPIIEIDAGRSVEVVILQGKSIKQSGSGESMASIKSTK